MSFERTHKITCIHCGLSAEDYSIMENRALSFGEPHAPCKDGRNHKFDFMPVTNLEPLATVPIHRTVH